MKRSIALLALFLATPALALPPQVAFPTYVPPPTSVASRAPGAADDYTAGYFPANSIAALAVGNVGAGCTGTPAIAIGAPGSGGIQATGHLVMASSGTAVLAGVIDNPGANYTSNPTVTVSGGGCTTVPVIAAQFNPTPALWNSPLGVFQMMQGAANAAVWNRISAVPLPLDSVANPVTAAAIAAGGSGYAVGNTVTLANGTVLTVATVSSGAVATVTVATAGNWPCGTTANPVAQASTSGSGTGATFTITIAGASAAYGTKLLTACYTANKAVDIVRASDSAVLTVGFVSRAFDTSTAQQFCANTTCLVSKWYDQSGLGNDMPLTGSARPSIDFLWQAGGVPLLFTNAAMPLPGTVPVSYTSLSVYAVATQTASGTSGGRIAVLGSASMSLSSNNGMTVGLNGTVLAAPFYAQTSQPDLYGTVAASTTSAFLSVGDREYACTSNCANAGSTTSGTIGYPTVVAMSAVTIAGRAYTTAERTAFRAAMDALYNLTPQVRDVLVLSGDSRTYGLNGTDIFGYPPQLAALLAVPQRLYNTGTSGDTAAMRLSNFSTQDAPPILQPHGKNAWIILWIGYNDMVTGGLAPAAIYGTITSYVTAAHALGWKVALSTETEGTNGSGGTYQQLDTLITTNAAGADAVIGTMAADPAWTPPYYTTCPSGFATLPHPTSCGYGFVALDTAMGFNSHLR